MNEPAHAADEERTYWECVVIQALDEADQALDWTDLQAATGLVDDDELEAIVTTLQKEGAVAHSGRRGGYVLVDASGP